MLVVLAHRSLTVLVSMLICGFVLVAVGPAPANAAPPTQSGGYQCLSFGSLVTAKEGAAQSIAVPLDGYALTYTAKEARMATGSFAYPGALRVTKAAKTWSLPAPVDPKDEYFELGALCAFELAPAPSGSSPSPPDVLAEGFWGGAHCCYGPTVYQYSGGAYRVVEDLTKPGVGKGLHWNPNEGFRPDKIGTAIVLESSDGAFPYTFGCYACTPAPTRLFTVADGRLIDVTTRYPAIIGAEAAAALSNAVHLMASAAYAGEVEGPLAQWAADKCELNEGAQMWQELEQLQAQGKLAAAERQSFDNKEPFPTQLKAFLLKQGYCQGQLSSGS